MTNKRCPLAISAKGYPVTTPIFGATSAEHCGPLMLSIGYMHCKLHAGINIGRNRHLIGLGRSTQLLVGTHVNPSKSLLFENILNRTTDDRRLVMAVKQKLCLDFTYLYAGAAKIWWDCPSCRDTHKYKSLFQRHDINPGSLFCVRFAYS